MAEAAEKKVNNYFDGLQVTTLHKVLFFIIMLSYFFEQMDNWNFGFIAPALMKSWGISMAVVAKINFTYFIGMTLGGLTGGVISDFIGRRRTFLGAILLFSCASLVNGLTNDLTVFTISRALTGFGVFCLMVTSQAYIAEMSPAESRGKWQGLIAAVGFCAVPFIGALCRAIIPLSPQAYRYIFYLGGLGFFGFLLGIKFLKESPRWLVSQKRMPEAEKIVEEISGVKVDLSEAAKKLVPREKVLEVLYGMFTGKYIKRTLVLLFLNILSVPPTFVVTVWTPTLLTSRGLSVEDSLTASFILMIGVPVGCYIASLISDKGGRKIPLSIMCTLIGVFSLIFGQVSGFALIVTVGFALIACVMATGFITFSYIAESYPTKMRNTTTGFHNAMGRLATSGVQLLVPVVFSMYSFAGVYDMVTILCWLPVAVVMIWGMRTGGKSLEEIG